MTLLPDEPLWFLDDAGQHTAHGSVLEAMQHLQAEHPELERWQIEPLRPVGTRTITAQDHYERREWTVRRA